MSYIKPSSQYIQLGLALLAGIRRIRRTDVVEHSHDGLVREKYDCGIRHDSDEVSSHPTVQATGSFFAPNLEQGLKEGMVLSLARGDGLPQSSPYHLCRKRKGERICSIKQTHGGP